MSKMRSLAALKRIRARLKREGKKVVFTNGCFDILHYGHVQYLADAKRAGDALVVAVNSDASVRGIKGAKRPIVDENDRMAVVAALESVDYVVLFNDYTPENLIAVLKPDVLVKGADWNKDDIVGKDVVEGLGGRVVMIPLAPGRSTTGIIQKIAGMYGA